MEPEGHVVKWRNFRGRIDPAVWPGALICVTYTLYSLGMILQPSRFSATPAYGNLTQVLDIEVWGIAYLLVAGLFAIYVAAVTQRMFGVIVHILGLIVTGYWLMAFIIRWLTDDATTVVNVASWLVLTLLLARSAALLPAATVRGDP